MLLRLTNCRTGHFLPVFLDLPAPWDAIKSSKEALKVSNSNTTCMQFSDPVKEQHTEVKKLV